MLNDQEKMCVIIGLFLVAILTAQIVLHFAGAWTTDIASILLIIYNSAAALATLVVLSILIGDP